MFHMQERQLLLPLLFKKNVHFAVRVFSCLFLFGCELHGLDYDKLNPNPAEQGYVLPLTKSVDPDQLASEANWSGSALFLVYYVNLYQQPGSSNLIGWQLEVGMAS